MYLKEIFILGAFIAVQINCQHLSLLKIFDMRNPVIVGNENDLQTHSMFSLMKNVMRQNQSICLMSTFRSDTIQQSPGNNGLKSFIKANSYISRTYQQCGPSMIE